MLIKSLLIIINTTYIALSAIFYEPFASFTYKPASFTKDVTVLQNYAIFSALQSGLYIFDIEDTHQSNLLQQVVEEEDYITQVSIVDIQQQPYIMAANDIKGICFYDTDQFEKQTCIDMGFGVISGLQVTEDKFLISGEKKISLMQINQGGFQYQILQTWEFSTRSFISMVKDQTAKYVFIADGPHALFLNIEDILNQNDNIVTTTWQYIETITQIQPVIGEEKQGLYVIDQVRGLFYTDISGAYDGSNNFNFANIHLIQKIAIQALQVTNDQSQLMVILRSIGIQIFDIQNREEIFLLQQISSIGSSTTLVMTQNEDKLLYCNGQILQIFEQLIPNLSLNIPNFFNNLQDKLIDDDTTYEETSPWRIIVSKDKNYIYTAGARNGAQIFSIEDPGNPIFITSVPVDDLNSPTDGVKESKDGNLLFVGEGGSGVKIVDITDKSNPQLLGQIAFPPNGDADDMFLTQDEQLMVVGYGVSGVSLVDISDLRNPTLMSTWDRDTPGGSVENVIINKNDTLVFASLRFYGVVILELDTTQKTLTKINQIQNGMTETTLLSRDEKFAFMIDGNVGIRIYNIEDIYNIYESNILSVSGFPDHMRQFQYEEKYDYLFIQQLDVGLMVCANVTDPLNPQVIMKYEIETENAFDLDCTLEYCYLVTNKGIRVVPLKNTVDIHKEFRILSNSTNGNTEKYPSNNLPIGQQLQVILVPLRLGGKVQINNLYHYNNYYLELIPSYMKFERSSLTLTIDVNKEGLKPGNLFQNNIILVQLSKQITSQSFTKQLAPISITDQDSEIIMQRAFELGYLDDQQFISQYFNPYEEIFPNEGTGTNSAIFTAENIAYCHQVLLSNLIQVPISLNFVQSLYFIPGDQDKNVIQSISQTVSITIEIISKDKAEFIQQYHTGALVDKYFFQMQGNINLVLSVLVNKLTVYVKGGNKQNIQLQVSIDDEINNPQKYFTNLEESSFLNIHKGIQQTKDNLQSLQAQVEKAFVDGVYADEEFIFQFSESTFQSEIDLPLTYTILVKLEGDQDFTDQLSGSWIQVSNKDRKVLAVPPISYLYKRIGIKVIVSDKYVEIEEIINIEVTNVPAIYIIQIIVSVLSPIITLLGFIRYRGYLYGVFCKKLYVDNKIYIRDGELFNLQIVLGKQQIRAVKILYTDLLQFIKKSNLKIENFLDKNYNLKIVKLEATLTIIIEKNPKKYNTKQFLEIDLLKNIKMLDPSYFIYQTLHCFIIYDILRSQKHKLSYQYYQQIKQYLIATSESQTQWFTDILRIENNDINQDQLNLPNLSFNTVKLHKMLKYLLKFKDNDQLNLEIKNLQIKFDNYKQCHLTKLIQNQVSHPLYFEKNSGFFQQLLVIYQNKIDSLIDLNLIINSIYCDCLGLRPYKFKKFSYGMTLNCDQQDILQIKALTKCKRWYAQIFPFMTKKLNLDYMNIVTGDQKPLPDWLQCNYLHGIAELHGIWSSNDSKDSEIMIRVVNIQKFTMKQFTLVRVHELNMKENKKKINNIVASQGYIQQLQNKSMNQSIMLNKSNKMQQSINCSSHRLQSQICSPKQREEIPVQSSLNAKNQKSLFLNKQYIEDEQNNQQQEHDHNFNLEFDNENQIVFNEFNDTELDTKGNMYTQDNIICTIQSPTQLLNSGVSSPKVFVSKHNHQNI